MIKLHRTTEYALMALRQMSRKRHSETGGVTSAREVAEHYGLPFEITAKTLLKLKDAGLIQSAQGARGGYTLTKDLSTMSLAEFLAKVEGPQALVACSGPASSAHAKKNSGCEYDQRCDIKHLIASLNSRVLGFLGSIRLHELVDGPGQGPSTSFQTVYQIEKFVAAGEEP